VGTGWDSIHFLIATDKWIYVGNAGAKCNGHQQEVRLSRQLADLRRSTDARQPRPQILVPGLMSPLDSTWERRDSPVSTWHSQPACSADATNSCSLPRYQLKSTFAASGKRMEAVIDRKS
jgi:hypothetical protein